MGYPVVQPKLLNYNTGYGWYYVMGYRFTALSAVTIDQLGGYFYGTKTVKLLNASYQVIASASITSANAWVYVGITPVQLVANQVYYVVVDVGGSGGAYGTVSSVPTTTSDIRIDYGAYQSGSAFDAGHTNAGTAVYGLVDVGISTQTDWTKNVSDSLSLSEAVGFGRNAHEADQLALADQVRALIVDHGWGVEAWSEARWGVVLRKQSADDSVGLADAVGRKPRARTAEAVLSLADSLQKRARMAQREALTLTDGIRSMVAVLRSDALSLLDGVSPQLFTHFTDTVGLADGLLALVLALRGDDVDMADLVSALAGVSLGDFTGIREELGLTPHVGIMSEDMMECNGVLYGDPARPNSYSISVGGGWRCSLHYSDATAYCEVVTGEGFLGSKFLRIKDDAAHTWKAFTASGQYLTKGKWYRASVRARSSEVRGTAAYLTYGADTRMRKYVSWGSTELGPDKGWVMKQATLLVPEDVASTGNTVYLYGHPNPNGTAAEVDFDGYRLEGPFDADPGLLHDSPGVVVGKSVAELAAITEALAASVAAYRSDLVSLADNLAASAGRPLGDVLPLLDCIASAVARGAQADAVGLADNLVKQMSAPVADLAMVADAFERKLGIPIAGELLVLADAVRSEARPAVAEVLSLADNLVAKLKAAAGDVATWSDGLEHLRIEPRAGESLATTDGISAGIGAMLADLVGLTEQLAAAVALEAWDDAAEALDELKATMTLATHDPTGVLDAMAAAVGSDVGADPAALADQVVRLVGKSVADLLASLDGIRAAAGSSLTDMGSASDGLSLTVKRTVGDLLGLADGIKFAVQAQRPVSARWGLGAWDSSVFGGVLGDLLGVTDQVSIAQGVALLAQDVLSLADELRARARQQSTDQVPVIDLASAWPRARTGDMVPTADGFAAQARPSIFDLLSVADALLRAVAGVMSGDALLSTDSLVQLAVGVLAGDLLSASDDSQLAVARLLSDLLALGDSALLRVGRVITDAVALADAVRTRTGLPLLDDAPLSEALACLVAMGVQDDSAALVDTIMAAVTVRHGMADGVDLLDELRLAVTATLADMLALPDHVSTQTGALAVDSTTMLDGMIAAARPRAAELLGLSDTQLQALVRAVQAGGLTLAEQLAAHTGSSPAEAQPVADALVAALRMARQADDLLTSIDTVRAAVVKLLPDDIGLSDQMMLGIRAARAEAASVADLLGLSSGKQLPADMVGVIDEHWLRAAVGLGPDRFGVLDRVRGRVLRVLQQVFIQGVQVPVSGLRVHHSASERVGTCSFSIPNPSPEVLALARQRAEVRVYLLDGEGTDFFAGRIVGNPVRARGTITTELQITVDDWTAASQDVFVQEVYTADSGTVDQTVRHMWAKYFGRPIRLEVTPTSRCIDLYRINYDSLFDATEQLAQLLGWVWFVDWDGADLVLRFFPPSSAVSAVTLSRVNRNVVANTARFGQDEQIKNSIYVFGGDGRSAPYTERLVADGEKAAYRLAYKPYRPPGEESGVIVLVGSVQQSVGIVGLHNVADYDVLLDFQQQQLAWREDNRPGAGAVIEARYSYAYPILVHLTDDQSVERFGLSESVVTDSKILDVRTAREVGRAQMRKSAWPRGYGSCEVLVSGLRAGQFVTVDMPTYGASGLYEILEVEKWIEGATVRRRVALNVADSPEARIAERLKEFARRLSSLESTQRADDISVQRILRDPGNLAISATGMAAGQIHDSAEDMAVPSEETVVAWRGLNAARVYATQQLLLSDEAAAAMGPKNNSISQVREHVRGGISFFGQAKWGEKPWGVSAS